MKYNKKEQDTVIFDEVIHKSIAWINQHAHLVSKDVWNLWFHTLTNIQNEKNKAMIFTSCGIRFTQSI